MWIGAILLLLAPAASLAAQQLPPLSSPAARRQITTPISGQQLVRLEGSVSAIARNTFAVGPVPASTPLNHILLLLRRSPERQQALEEFMRQQYDPNSPNFHRWLTPEQFGKLYGPSPQDVDKITGWLRQQGFTVNRVATGGLFIDFSGSTAQVEAAFHTPIRYYRLPGAKPQQMLHYANASAPMIPAALAPVVSGFRSLTDFHPSPMPERPAAVRLDRRTGKWDRLAGDAGFGGAATGGSSSGRSAIGGSMTSGSGPGAEYLVGPQDYAEIYGVKQVWAQPVDTANGPQTLVGTGQTIGVAGDTDLASADIASFRDQFGISALGPHGGVVVDHPPASVCPAPNPAQNDGEGYIDAEWAGAMAPDATIDFVACGDQGATSGADLAAAYMIQDPAHAAKIGVLSTSYGFCEANPISEPAEFYVSLWQQAAAEGITVVVATGDAGGAECDEFTGEPYAVSGLAVDAEASTPYNIAAGGTDFSDTFSGTTADYWAPNNGPNFESAKSYIPEMPWDDTCASPAVLATFGNGLDTSAGPDGFCSVASRQPANPSTGMPPFFSLFAGSGGLSNISPKPAWQNGVTGIPAANRRALPDISMFASSGLVWGHSLLFCDSAFLPAGASCDFSNPSYAYDLESGGTSFVAPAFAGIMALINQKYGRQGQADNVLYALAARQYIDSTSSTEPNLATCAAYLGPGVLPSCYFHDISSTPNPNPATRQQTPFIAGTNSVPCSGTASAPGTFSDTSTDPASNREDCYGYQITVANQGGKLFTTHDYFGILSTADDAASPAYSSTPGYDLVTGLGSPNVAALIDAPEWSGLTITNSSLPDAIVGAAYSQALSASGRIPPYNWTIVGGSLPDGLKLSSSGEISGTPTAVGVSTFTVQVADSETPPTAATVRFSLAVIAPAATSTTLTSSLATAGTSQNVTFTATVSGGATLPTGTVTFYNGSDAIGTATLASGAAAFSTSFASTGALSIHAVYSGDATHLGSESNTVTETIVTPSVSVSVQPESLIVPFGDSGTITITLTPKYGFTGDVSFACGALPAHLSCVFAPPAISLTASGGTATGVLTIRTTAGALADALPVGGTSGGAIAAIALWPPAFFVGFFGWLKRKKRPTHRKSLLLLAIPMLGAAGVAAMLITGCGRQDRTTPDGAYNVPIQISYPGGSQSVSVVVHVR